MPSNFNNFPALAKAIRKGTGVAVKTTADNIAQYAASIVPVDTGALQNSIGSEQVDDLHAQAYAGTDHAVFVEFGTSHMAAQPYMTPAAEHEKANCPQTLQISVQNALGSV